MKRFGCQEQALEQVRRVQRGVRKLVDDLMAQLHTLETIAASPHPDREALGEKMRRARSALLDGYWQVERQSGELGRLYAASCRLHRSTDTEAVLEAIHEVTVDLTGCSRVALWEVGSGLDLTAAWGAGAPLPTHLTLESGPLARAVADGVPWSANPQADSTPLGGARLTAVVPLFAGSRVNALLTLLEDAVPSVELAQVFELLGTHAGAALHSARLTQRSRALLAV